ncbi:hypothetical protein K470DRAFT_222928 [Piedraia hortae CBS 480.64]|uniref:ATP-dependent (S)-NAD(P)H-hydrate dehydratase n=1 Tax=Piedraia hortae CBS 480.64 TaxID=1314780 RepID=A0A6A7BQV4_9PEZI|nr:hypothetical protein K470DRAFT_222928 [Piedraia hortae CBS 480.64]
MSRAEILKKVHKMVPPMLDKFHKGQLGRVGVIGGSQDYTGAPYFSAMASAKLGCDMSHVICEPEAAQVIKTYSPNLMVHPYMRQKSKLGKDESAETVAQEVTGMLDRLHVVVIGPGLGRDEVMQETCARVIQEARKRGVALVIDADALFLVQNRPELVQGYKECILTPNVVEFARLAKALKVKLGDDEGAECAALAKAFHGVTVIRKGRADYVSDGETTLVCDGEGGLKRSGGQGDTLTGSLATLLAWRKAYLDKLWDHEGDMTAQELLLYSAFGGSAITRECSRLAYKDLGRSMQASDLTGRVHAAFCTVVGDV